MASRPGKRPFARRNPSALPTRATTIVASKAACRETDSGLQTQGGIPSAVQPRAWDQPDHTGPVLSGAPQRRLWAFGSLDDARPGHPPVVVGDYDVTELLRFLGVVGHQHRRDSRRDDHPSDQASQLTANCGVER